MSFSHQELKTWQHTHTQISKMKDMQSLGVHHLLTFHILIFFWKTAQSYWPKVRWGGPCKEKIQMKLNLHKEGLLARAKKEKLRINLSKHFSWYSIWEAANIPILQLWLTRSRLEPTICCTWGKHANDYTTDAVFESWPNFHWFLS